MGESLTQEQRVGELERSRGGVVADALAKGKRAVLSHAAEVICALLLLLMSINLLVVISRKSITADEIVMIPAAYYHLIARNTQLVLEHPPLSKLLSAVPLLFIQPNEIPPAEDSAIKSYGERTWAYQERFWWGNRQSFEAISFWSRAPMIALALGLGVVIFLFARQLFNDRAGLLAVALYSLEPTVLAHSRVVQTDIAATFGYLLVFFAIYHYWRAPAPRRALWIGAASGLALLAKFSMLLLAPLLFVLALIWFWAAPKRGLKRQTVAAHACLVALATLLVVNAAYFFQSRPLSERDLNWIVSAFPSNHGTVLSSIRLLSNLVPTDFLLGIYWQLQHLKDGHPASLLGMQGRFGWWYYFPVAFALKTTIPFLALSLASVAWALKRVFSRREFALLLLLVPLGVYTIFVMTSRINIGVRYFLPAFPFLFIMGGALLDRLLSLLGRARRAGLALALVVLSWVGVEAVRAFPNHMTYMNQLAAPRPRWYYLSDSNIEWGDDVRELALYLRARGETRVRALLLGGFATLAYYDVAYLDALELSEVDKPETRYIAIGASFLNGSTVPGRDDLTEEERVNYFDFYRRRTPEAVIGGSIYLYRMSE